MDKKITPHRSSRASNGGKTQDQHTQDQIQALNLYGRGDGGPDPDRNTDIEVGFNVGAGFVHRGRFFAEFKLGALHSPRAKIAVGWTFK